MSARSFTATSARGCGRTGPPLAQLTPRSGYLNVTAALDHLESHSALRHVPASRPPSCLSGGERLLLDVMESLRSGLLFDAAARLDDSNWLAVVGAIHALRPIDVRKYGAFVFDTPERASDRHGWPAA